MQTRTRSLRIALPRLAYGGWLRLLFALLFIALVSCTLLLIYHAASMASAPGELNFAESTWLFAALRARHGLSFYFDYHHPPYIPMYYTPLYLWLAGLLGAATGASDSETIVITRLVTLAATLAVACLIYLCCTGLRARPWPALIAALLFFTPTSIFILWSFVARSDMLALAFGLGAITCLVWKPSALGPPLAGGLAALAFATKQTELAPILASSYWLWSTDSRPKLLQTLGAFAAVLALIAVPVGPDGLKVLVHSAADVANHRWTFDWWAARLGEFLPMFGLIVPVGLAGIVRPATPNLPRRLVLSYGVAAAVVLLYSIGRIGSSNNYYLELVAISALLAGLGLQWLTELGSLPAEILKGVVILSLAPLAIQTAQALNTAQHGFTLAGADDRKLQALASPTRGPVLSENGYVALDGPNPPALLDPFFFSLLADVHRWDPGPLREMVADRYFKAIVLRLPIEDDRMLPSEIMSAIAANYRFSARQEQYYVYIPNGPTIIPFHSKEGTNRQDAKREYYSPQRRIERRVSIIMVLLCVLCVSAVP